MRSKYHQRLLTEEERFFSWVNQTETCWLWYGALDRDGYGHFRLGKPSFRSIPAHHYLFGPIPVGLQIDHLCRQRNCVRRDHLEAVTCYENLHRSPITAASIRSLAVTCKHGHPLTGSNLIRDKTGYRQCRFCVNWRSNHSRQGNPPPLAEIEDWLRKRYFQGSPDIHLTYTSAPSYTVFR